MNWKKKIGFVQQEPSAFKRSNLENIRYGKLDATDDECIEAARQANIMKFFTKEKMNQILDVGKKDIGGYKKKREKKRSWPK